MKKTKAFKSCSIKEIEKAIATGVSNLTNTEVDAEIEAIEKHSASKVLGGEKDKFSLKIVLNVGVSYGESSEIPSWLEPK